MLLCCCILIEFSHGNLILSVYIPGVSRNAILETVPRSLYQSNEAWSSAYLLLGAGIS
jgi:hypothetical protein